MNNTLLFIVIYLIGELFSFIVFNFVRRLTELNDKGDKVRAALIGSLERAVVFFGLTIEISQVIIMFGALKIGSMVNDKKQNNKSSDYFLIGNLVSVLLAMLYYFVYKTFKLS